jgi:hypothetical protein
VSISLASAALASSVEAIEKKRETEKSEKSDFRIFSEIANIASAPVGTPRLIGGAGWESESQPVFNTCAESGNGTRVLRTGVPICASTWDQDPEKTGSRSPSDSYLEMGGAA